MKLRSWLPAITTLTALLALWEVVARISHISDQILPAPSAVAAALTSHIDLLAVHSLQTLAEATLGLAAAVALGAGMALALDASAWFRRAVYPLLITSQTIPMVALAPLLLVWLGFGLTPKIVIVVLYCFFPVTIALASGLAAVDREHLDLMRSLRATYWQTLISLKLPAALPAFFAGLKIAVTYAMTAAIVGEYVGAYQGLGVYIQTSANSHAVPVVFAAIFVIAAISTGLFGLVMLAERLFMPWRKK